MRNLMIRYEELAEMGCCFASEEAKREILNELNEELVTRAGRAFVNLLINEASEDNPPQDSEKNLLEVLIEKLPESRNLITSLKAELLGEIREVIDQELLLVKKSNLLQ